MPEDAGSIYSSIFLKLDQLEKGVVKVHTLLSGMEKKAQTQSAGFAGFWKKAFQTAFGFSMVQIIHKITAAIRNALEVFAGYQQSMQNVKSVTGATRTEFQAMSEAAKEAGETTRFTAREAADALYYLGSAGFTAQQSIAALDGVLQLAGATQSDLASTSEAVASIISQYSLQAEDAGRISNVFAAAIGNSQATMEKLTNSFRQVGPVAAGFGYTIEETTGILQELYNAGFQGENAGRALKSALADLASPTSNMEKIFSKLNISLESVNPATTEFADIIDILGKSGMDTADIIDAFGKIAGPQMAVLIKQGGDALRKYTDDVTNTNAAAEMYKIQNDSLAGSMDFLKSKLEGTAIAIFEKLEPGMRDMIDSFIDFLDAAKPIGQLLGSILGLILKIGSVAAKPAIELIRRLSGFFSDIRVPANAASEGLKRVTEQIKRAGELGNTAKNLQNLTDEYEQLKSKTNLTESEQDRLRSVIMQIQKIMPDAVSGFDSYGNAIEVSGEKSKEAARQMLLAREATIKNSLAELKASEAIYKNIIKENEAKADSAKKERNRLIAESATAEARLATLRTFVLRYEELSDKIGQPFALARDPIEAYNLALLDMNKELKNVGLNFKVVTDGFAAGEDPIKKMYEEMGTAKKVLDDLQKSLSKPTKAEQLYEESINKIQEIADLELELIQLQKALNEIDKIDPVETGSDKKLDDLKRISEEFWNNYRSEMEKATRESTLFGDKQDALRSSLEFLKSAYLELLEKGLDPTSSTMQRIRQEYDLTLVELLALIEAEKNHKDELEKKEKIENDIIDMTTNYYSKLEELGESEEKLIEIERNRALMTIYASGASEEAINKAIEAANIYYDALQSNLEKTKENAEETKITWQDMAESIYDYSLNLADALSNLWSEMTQNRLDELDAQLQAELENAGLLEETERERLQRLLDDAIEAGDEETAQQLQDDLDRLALEEEYEKKRAELEYEAAMVEWRLKMAAALASAAKAVVDALAVPFPLNIPAIAFATLIGGVQTAIVYNQKPEAPTFQSGGIYTGTDDNESNNVQLHPPEMILNQDQMSNLFDAIDNNDLGGGGGSTPVEITVIIELEGTPIYRGVQTAQHNSIIKFKASRLIP